MKKIVMLSLVAVFILGFAGSVLAISIPNYNFHDTGVSAGNVTASDGNHISTTVIATRVNLTPLHK